MNNNVIYTIQTIDKHNNSEGMKLYAVMWQPNECNFSFHLIKLKIEKKIHMIRSQIPIQVCKRIGTVASRCKAFSCIPLINK